MTIPFNDFRSQHSYLFDDIVEHWRALMESNDLIDGDAVRAFERSFGQYIGARHAIGCGSLADSLVVALRALDLEPGEEVIVPAYGPIEPANAVARLYGTPIFVDIEPHTYGLDPTKLQEIVGEKTRAIIASHMFGGACVIDQIHQFAEANGLPVIEDATQAVGATYMNRKLGSFGMIGVFGLDPASPLGGLGQAGMIVTDNEQFAERMRRMSCLGRSEQGLFEEVGVESRLDSFQAVALSRKLEELDETNEDRIENARLLDRLLEQSPVKRPRFSDDRSRVFAQYVIEHEQRDDLEAFLAERGIETSVTCGLPIPLQPVFEYMEFEPGMFPVADNVAERNLALPIYTGLKKRQIEEIASAVNEFFAVAAE